MKVVVERAVPCFVVFGFRQMVDGDDGYGDDIAGQLLSEDLPSYSYGKACGLWANDTVV